MHTHQRLQLGEPQSCRGVSHCKLTSDNQCDSITTTSRYHVYPSDTPLGWLPRLACTRRMRPTMAPRIPRSTPPRWTHLGLGTPTGHLQAASTITRHTPSPQWRRVDLHWPELHQSPCTGLAPGRTPCFPLAGTTSPAERTWSRIHPQRSSTTHEPAASSPNPLRYALRRWRVLPQLPLAPTNPCTQTIRWHDHHRHQPQGQLQWTTSSTRCDPEKSPLSTAFTFSPKAKIPESPTGHLDQEGSSTCYTSCRAIWSWPWPVGHSNTRSRTDTSPDAHQTRSAWATNSDHSVHHTETEQDPSTRLAGNGQRDPESLRTHHSGTHSTTSATSSQTDQHQPLTSSTASYGPNGPVMASGIRVSHHSSTTQDPRWCGQFVAPTATRYLYRTAASNTPRWTTWTPTIR